MAPAGDTNPLPGFEFPLNCGTSLSVGRCFPAGFPMRYVEYDRAGKAVGSLFDRETES